MKSILKFTFGYVAVNTAAVVTWALLSKSFPEETEPREVINPYTGEWMSIPTLRDWAIYKHHRDEAERRGQKVIEQVEQELNEQGKIRMDTIGRWPPNDDERDV